MRLESGGDDDVLPRRQPQPRADLPQVDEELGASAGGVGEEEVPFQVDPRPARKLRGELVGQSRAVVLNVTLHITKALVSTDTVEGRKARTSLGICKEHREKVDICQL